MMQNLSRSKILKTVGLIAIVLLLGWWASKKFLKPPATTPAPAVVPVTTDKVMQEDVPLSITGVGTVQALASVTVKARVDGQLEKVSFTEGQDVRAGQLLAQLDPRIFQAQLAQALAQKNRDEAQLANARIDLQRYNTLMGLNSTTQQTLDTQRALVSQMQAAVAMDNAQISTARVQLGFTRITAPLSGRIGARLVDPGNIVHASDANGLLVINQIDPIAVVFTVPEANFRDVNNALRASKQPLAVLVYARDGDEVLGRGTLVLVNNQIDTDTGTLQLKARIPNSKHTLWPGQYVNVRLMLGELKQALTVPAAAVQRSQSGTYVFVVRDDQSAQIQPVQVLQIEGGKAVITQGLKADEKIVLDGQYKLKPGSRVSEVAAQPDKTAEPPRESQSGTDKGIPQNRPPQPRPDQASPNRPSQDRPTGPSSQVESSQPGRNVPAQ
ncbi:MAG: efflux RND transporter periplasmic adaptor subunit [Pseudomonadota bacterium]